MVLSWFSWFLKELFMDPGRLSWFFKVVSRFFMVLVTFSWLPTGFYT